MQSADINLINLRKAKMAKNVLSGVILGQQTGLSHGQWVAGGLHLMVSGLSNMWWDSTIDNNARVTTINFKINKN